MKTNNFNDFCQNECDGLYDPKFSFEEQCTGYKKLREMVEKGIIPFSIEETQRWESNPTALELLSEPDIRYLRFLHPVLRPFIIKNWTRISEMDLEESEDIKLVQPHDSVEDFFKAYYKNSFIEIIKKTDVEHPSDFWFEICNKKHHGDHAITSEKITVQIEEVNCEYISDYPCGYYKLDFYFWHENEMYNLDIDIKS